MYDDDEDAAPVLGLVPVEGRRALPFALLHGESLVAVASWALGRLGVDLLGFEAPWPAVQDSGAAVVVHDPLCPGTPVDFLAQAIRLALDEDVVAVGARAVTDTVAQIDPAGTVGATVDRAGLRSVLSPVVLPASAVARLPGLPVGADLAELVAVLSALSAPVRFLDAPPAARRVGDDTDLRLLEALTAGRAGAPRGPGPRGR